MRIRQPLARAIIAAALLALLAGASPARAADRAITITNFAFSPPTIAIDVGASVTWTNNDGVGHTTTSDTSAWDSGTLGQGGTFQHTFSAAGVYPYFCAIHPSMRGSILVGPRTYLPLVIR